MVSAALIGDGAEQLAVGAVYDTRNPQRFGQIINGVVHLDCSGLGWRAHHDLGVAIPKSSGTQAKACRDHGWFSWDQDDIDAALFVRGQPLFKGPDHGLEGEGADGHVGYSYGDGVRTIEARGRVAGCGVYDGRHRGWASTGRFQGVDYVVPAVHPHPIPVPPRKRVNMEIVCYPFPLLGVDLSRFRPGLRISPNGNSLQVMFHAPTAVAQIPFNDWRITGTIEDPPITPGQWGGGPITYIGEIEPGWKFQNGLLVADPHALGGVTCQNDAGDSFIVGWELAEQHHLDAMVEVATRLAA